MAAIEPVVGHLETPVATDSGAPPPVRRRSEALYFALRNRKLVIGLVVVVSLLVLAVIGPWVAKADPFAFGFVTGAEPSAEN